MPKLNVRIVKMGILKIMGVVLNVITNYVQPAVITPQIVTQIVIFNVKLALLISRA